MFFLHNGPRWIRPYVIHHCLLSALSFPPPVDWLALYYFFIVITNICFVKRSLTSLYYLRHYSLLFFHHSLSQGIYFVIWFWFELAIMCRRSWVQHPQNCWWCECMRKGHNIFIIESNVFTLDSNCVVLMW